MSTRASALVSLALATSVVLGLAGCASAEPSPTPSTPPDDGRTSAVSVQRDVVYGNADAEELLLNACLPPQSDEPAAAVILVHGGAFDSGDRNAEGMMALCTELAGQGFAAFNIDYRLAPASTYPAQVDDVSTAVRWARDPEQVERFGIDPDRIGLFGSSAGAIMAASVGTRGEGDLTTEARVAAVLALSPAVDLTAAGLDLGTPSAEAQTVISQYLGCSDVADCPVAEEASPLYSVDASDPPFYIAAGETELVPVAQAQALESALTAVGVPVTLSVQEGGKHALQLLDNQTRLGILDFLTGALGRAE
jgi:acetyl esterase